MGCYSLFAAEKCVAAIGTFCRDCRLHSVYRRFFEAGNLCKSGMRGRNRHKRSCFRRFRLYEISRIPSGCVGFGRREKSAGTKLRRRLFGARLRQCTRNPRGEFFASGRQNRKNRDSFGLRRYNHPAKRSQRHCSEENRRRGKKRRADNFRRHLFFGRADRRR